MANQTKVNIKTDGVLKKVEGAFKNIIKDNSMYIEIANFSKERIQNYARLQKRMTTDGEDKTPLPELSKNYIEYRQGLSYWRTTKDKRKIKIQGKDPKFKGTGKFFIPTVKRSQLTLTGQFLDGLIAKVLRSGSNKGSVQLEIGGKRNDGVDNKDIYKWLTDRDSNYEILQLSKKAIERIRTIVLTYLRKELIKQRLKK